MHTADWPEWVSVDELAERLGVPKATLYAYNYQGTGPVRHRFGRHVRYHRDDVAAWVASKAVD